MELVNATHTIIDGDGDTGVSDFLAVLGLWGPC